jgi:hypothetical protein
MKKALLIFAAFAITLGVFSCRKKGETPPGILLDAELLKDTTYIELLDSATYSFDTINQGDKVETSFRFKNVGNHNLVISRAFGSCGCTVPSYPKEPVKPGDVATINVIFNSAGKSNDQMKSVTVVCNTSVRNEQVYLKGFVIGEEE